MTAEDSITGTVDVWVERFGIGLLAVKLDDCFAICESLSPYPIAEGDELSGPLRATGEAWVRNRKTGNHLRLFIREHASNPNDAFRKLAKEF